VHVTFCHYNVFRLVKRTYV